MEWQHRICTPDTPFVFGSQLTYYYHLPDRWQSGSGADSKIVRDRQMLAINSPQLHVCVQQLALQK